MGGKAKEAPDRLYLYRLFCEGCTLKVLSEHKDIGDLWSDILAREKSEERIDFWEPRGEGYEEIIVRPSKIVAVDRMAETDLVPEQPNREQRRKDDDVRRSERGSLDLKGGGIRIGQQAKKVK